MAYTQSTGYKAPGLNKLATALRKQGKDLRGEIKKVHRKFAKVIAKEIKAEMPKTGGLTAGTYQKNAGIGKRKRIAAARKKEGSKHDTKRGAMARSVKTQIRTDASAVLGGDARAPHYAVNEFGGAVWWRKRRGGVKAALNKRRVHRSHQQQFAKRGKQVGGHIIVVRNRSAKKGKGVEGWFFFPTAFREVPKMIDAYDRELNDAVERSLRGVRQ